MNLYWQYWVALKQSLPRLSTHFALIIVNVVLLCCRQIINQNLINADRKHDPQTKQRALFQCRSLWFLSDRHSMFCYVTIYVIRNHILALYSSAIIMCL